MLIRFQGPEPWRSRGVQLLWLLPQAQVEENPESWDLSLEVAREGDELCLALKDGRGQVKRRVPAQSPDFLRALFSLLSSYWGSPISPWGIVTGVRPGKIAAGLLAVYSPAQAALRLEKEWLLRKDKARLLLAAVGNGYPLLRPEGLSLYVSVPFCPSRCHYCSFASLPLALWRDKLGEYVRRGAAELSALLAACRQEGIEVNSIYVGGGTPTALDPDQLGELLAPARGSRCEFTVEAGRPDTLSSAHLAVFRELGVNRLSVNSQYPLDSTLRAIGREHTAAQFYRALDLAVAAGLGPVNTDLIIGLPGQTPADFARVLSRLAAAGAANITLHALALKRGAQLRHQYLAPEAAEAIAQVAYERLDSLGYQPYYLYRQRNIASNLENVGFGLLGSYCYYNIASIAEAEPVLGVGAGAVSKLGRRGALQPLVNPRDPNQYLARWDQLLQHKLRDVPFCHKFDTT